MKWSAARRVPVMLSSPRENANIESGECLMVDLEIDGRIGGHHDRPAARAKRHFVGHHERT